MNKKIKNKKISQFDKKVLEITQTHKNKGWNIKADLLSYKKLDIIGKSKRIPDIQAIIHRATKLFEIETPSTATKEINRRLTFQRFVSYKPRTTFTAIQTGKWKTKTTK